MDFRVLGPVTVEEAGANVALGGQRQRSLLAVLVLSRGRTVGTETLVDAIWGEAPPGSAAGSLQVAVSRVRRAIGADRVAKTPGGYRCMRMTMRSTWLVSNPVLRKPRA